MENLTEHIVAIARVEEQLRAMDKRHKREMEGLDDFKKAVYKRLNWITSVVLVLATVTLIMHPTVAAFLKIL